MNAFSFKDFEQVRLKSTLEQKIGDKIFVPGETIVLFDRIQIAGLDAAVQSVSAKGGFDNRARVTWTTMNQISVNFSQGVFSKTQLAVLTNSHVGVVGVEEAVDITYTEAIESDRNGFLTLRHPLKRDLFVYGVDGSSISYEMVGGRPKISQGYLNVIATYVFGYTNGAQVLDIGQNLLSGYLELEGQTRIKDDVTGKVVTGIIKIPRLQLMSRLSIRLGENADPVVGNFSGVASPVGSRGNSYITEVYFLNDDINSDL